MKDFIYRRELIFAAIAVFLLLVLTVSAYESFSFMLSVVEKSTQVVTGNEILFHFNVESARKLLQ